MKIRLIIILVLLSINVFPHNITKEGQLMLDRLITYEEEPYFNEAEKAYIKRIEGLDCYIAVRSGRALFDYDINESELDFLRFVAYSMKKYFNINIKFIFVKSEKELEDLLKDKKVDLVLGTPKTQEKQLLFKFSYPILTKELGVYSLTGKLSDIKSLYLAKGVVLAEDLQLIFSSLESSFEYELIEVEEMDYNLLKSKEVGIIDSLYALRLINELGMKNINFSPYITAPVYIAYKGDMDEDFINVMNIGLSSTLGKYISDYYRLIIKESKKNLFKNNLTDTEKAYLESNKEFSIYLQSNHFPHIFYNDELGEFSGLFVDILKDYTDLTDQELKIVNKEYISSTLLFDEFKNSKEASYLLVDGSLNEPDSIIESQTIFNEQVILVGELASPVYSGNPKDYTSSIIGIVDDNVGNKVIEDYYKRNKSQIRLFNSYNDLVDAIEQKEITYGVMHSGVYHYYKTFKQRHSLKEVASFFDISIPLGTSITNRVQVDIFNKALEDETLDIDLFLNKWKTYTIDFEQIIAQKNQIIQSEFERQKKTLNYLTIISVFLLIAIVFIVFIYKKVKDVNRRLYKQMHFEPEMDIPNKRTFLEERDSIELGDLDAVACMSVVNQSELNQLYTFSEGEGFKRDIAIKLKSLAEQDLISNLYYVNNIVIIIIRNIKKSQIEERIKEIKRQLKEEFENKVVFRIAYAMKEVDNGNFDKVFEKSYFLVNSSGQGEVVEATLKKLDSEKELLYLANDLPRAIEANEIVPYFQPKVSCSTGKVEGGEALARWIHQEKGIVPPFKFIGRAEENGNIIDIDLTIADASVAKLKQWQVKGIVDDSFILSFNLSPKTLQLDDIDSKIASILNKYRVSPGNIEVEVTERVIIDNYEHFKKVISRFRDMGVLVAIDDFSAGNASLDYILKIDFTTLKIDRSLLTGIVSESRKKIEIYKAVVDIGKKLNMKLVAEGVEEEEEAKLIRSFNVDEIQGYFYSKPLVESDFLQYLSKNTNIRKPE